MPEITDPLQQEPTINLPKRVHLLSSDDDNTLTFKDRTRRREIDFEGISTDCPLPDKDEVIFSIRNEEGGEISLDVEGFSCALCELAGKCTKLIGGKPRAIDKSN